MSNILCIGKNYLNHAKELGDAVPENPVIFLKPSSILVSAAMKGQVLEVVLPKSHGPVHHECELVFKLDSKGNILAFTLGLDLTLRDLQSQLKNKGLPWELSKVFQGSAIIGPWVPLKNFSDSPTRALAQILESEFEFRIEGQVKQKAKGTEMRFSPQVCLDFIQEHFPLTDGDILFTGTPVGVGPLVAGQTTQLISSLVDQQPLYEVKFI